MKRFLLAGASLLSIAVACPQQTSAALSWPPTSASNALELLQKKPSAKKPASPTRPSKKSPPTGSAEKRDEAKRGAAKRDAEAGGGAKGSSHDAKAAPSKKPVAPLNLAWPVTGRRIVEAYGERTNPTTRTVTLNPGINIATKKGSPVRAAAAGKVSLVSWLPGYGTFVIVEHRDGYRTVYARIASTSVARGATLKTGASIGPAAGASLHFEVWRGKTRLDPSRLLPGRPDAK